MGKAYEGNSGTAKYLLQALRVVYRGSLEGVERW